MKLTRRKLLQTAALTTPAILAGCGYTRVDPWNVLIRSDIITTLDEERACLAKASLSRTDDGRIQVLTVRGTPYERGYQHGALLRNQVQVNLNVLYKNAVKTYHFAELFAEAFERMRPYLPQEYLDEMRGLAHGARLPLHVVHHIHALPSLTEWGGKHRLKGIVKRMMAGETLEGLGTSCSNLSVDPKASADGEMYTVRVLDWGLHKISRLHEHPLLLVSVPDTGISSVTVTWMGFIGAVSGMNAEGITLGEMGYKSPPNERLDGKPMIFLLRDVLSQAHNLADVRKIIGTSRGDNSFVFLMSDGKTGGAQLYIKDADRFLVFNQGDTVTDDGGSLQPVPQCVYGGHDNAVMHNLLSTYRGKITPEILMKDIIPPVAMKSNFHNVIYRPGKLQLWVANAASPTERAAEQPYTFFDLGMALGR